MYSSEKAAGLTGRLLELGGGELNDIKLAKMQYLAERVFLVEHMATFVDDELFSLKWGPVLSRTVNLSTKKVPNPSWEEWFGFLPYPKQGDNTIVLKVSPPVIKCLPEAFLDCIDVAFSELKNLGKFQAHDYMVDRCPEYTNDPSQWPRQITLEEIFVAEGYAKHDAVEIANEIRYYSQTPILASSRGVA